MYSRSSWLSASHTLSPEAFTQKGTFSGLSQLSSPVAQHLTSSATQPIRCDRRKHTNMFNIMLLVLHVSYICVLQTYMCMLDQFDMFLETGLSPVLIYSYACTCACACTLAHPHWHLHTCASLLFQQPSTTEQWWSGWIETLTDFASILPHNSVLPSQRKTRQIAMIISQRRHTFKQSQRLHLASYFVGVDLCRFVGHNAAKVLGDGVKVQL